MLLDNLKLLLEIYYRPRAAFSRILDRGSLAFAAGAALLVGGALEFATFAPVLREVRTAVPPAAQAPSPAPGDEEADLDLEGALAARAADPRRWLPTMVLSGSVTGVAALALLYAPVTLLLVTLLEPIGSFGVALRRDFGGLLACTLMGWTAARLPPALVALTLAATGSPSPLVGLGLSAVAFLAFLALMVPVLLTVFGARLRTALVTVCVSWLAFALQGFLMFLASPFLAYWAWQYMRGDMSDVMHAFGSRQSYRRHLEAATLNPRDADAHYQLGLIHMQRRQHAQALERFKAAIEIDPALVDAHYQLGRVARAESRWEDAIRHFEAALLRDAAHASHEVWREAGAVYLATGADEHAHTVLQRFVEARPYDPEGLFRLGLACKRLGRAEEARALFERCDEAARTSPPHRQRHVREWRNLARQENSNTRKQRQEDGDKKAS